MNNPTIDLGLGGSGGRKMVGKRPGGSMRRLAVLVTTFGLAPAGCSPPGCRLSADGAATKATDIGVTPIDLHRGGRRRRQSLRAELLPGRGERCQGAVEYVNSQGGIAGRKLELDFIDSQLTPKTRTAGITACQDDFALVGTAAAFMTTIEDEVNCPDLAGKATGLPDFAGFVTGVQQCSPVAFPVNPPQLVCTTKDDHPQTF